MTTLQFLPVAAALQPMTTAPRNGSEVWVMPRLGYLCVCRYVDGSWLSLDGREYSDKQVNGWLDIAALVRDSERLANLAALDGADVMRSILHNIRYPYGLAEFRAAIDKEATK